MSAPRLAPSWARRDQWEEGETRKEREDKDGDIKRQKYENGDSDIANKSPREERADLGKQSRDLEKEQKGAETEESGESLDQREGRGKEGVKA